MKLNIEVLEKVALASRLELSQSEKETFPRQLSQILDYIDKLKEIDTQNVDPAIHVLRLENVFRQDKVEPSLSQEEALRNAPEENDGYFVVPKIVD